MAGKAKQTWTSSGIIDAICNVQGDETKALDELIGSLTRQLAIARAVREAMDGEPQPNGRPVEAAPAALRPRKPKAARTGKLAVRVTDKTRQVAELLLERGSMSKEQIAERLGWAHHAVTMVLGRSKQHFIKRPDGMILVADDLAKILGA